MIEVFNRIVRPDWTVRWLEKNVRPHLSKDISSYAQGRLRVWLRVEPDLRGGPDMQGIPVSDNNWDALQNQVGWPFDYALVTYSGDGQVGAGINPHRDASYADYEAVSVHLTGECRFSYWEGRHGFGNSPNTVNYQLPSRGAVVVVVDGVPVQPTAVIVPQHGDVLRFNCKNLHQSEPSPGRWNINFWRKKGVR